MSSSKAGASFKLFSRPVDSADVAQRRAEEDARQPSAPSRPSDSGSDSEESDSDIDTSTFSGLGLDKWLVESCASVGITAPTPVQAACVPVALKGQDMISCAPTGSGKTAAFALPILQRLSVDPYGVFAVVLTAGRELAQQIADQFRAFGEPMKVRVATVIGGLDFTRQSLELAKRPHIIVATPGRLADHLSRGATKLRLKHVKYVVLDEADRLLDSSMAPDLDTIFGALPAASSGRHTLMFSATMTRNLERAQGLFSAKPFTWSHDASPTTVKQLREGYLLVSPQAKLAYVAYMMRAYGPLATAEEEETWNKELGIDAVTRAKSAIVFVKTKYSAQLLMETFSELGILCVSLHSAMSQPRRLAALGKFKSCIARVMVATDVASRGLDIPQVELVVNFDIPRNPDDYIHRVGRTARAGRGGMAVSIITQYDVELVLAIEKVTGVKWKEFEGVEEEAVLRTLGKVATAREMAKIRLAETGFEEKLAAEKARKERQRAEQEAFLDDSEKKTVRSDEEDEEEEEEGSDSESEAKKEKDVVATPKAVKAAVRTPKQSAKKGKGKAQKQVAQTARKASAGKRKAAAEASRPKSAKRRRRSKKAAK